MILILMNYELCLKNISKQNSNNNESQEPRARAKEKEEGQDGHNVFFFLNPKMKVISTYTQHQE
jgi:hypothetical protein